MKLKLLALLACGCLLLSLVACGGGSSSSDDTGTDTSDGASSVTLNDTGQYFFSDGSDFNDSAEPDEYPGQDAYYGRDADAAAGLLEKVGAGKMGFDFTKLDDEGNELGATALSWSCVRDNHTGLVWEVKLDDITSVRDLNQAFTHPDETDIPSDPAISDLIAALNDYNSSAGLCTPTGVCPSTKSCAPSSIMEQTLLLSTQITSPTVRAHFAGQMNPLPVLPVARGA